MPWTFPYLSETKELNEATRANAPGDFVLLSNGYTHYEIGGPESGRRVVLVHGFSVPYFIWDPTFEFLTNSGFRVLRYDLIGRGYSDKPRVRYDIDLFCKQLRELTDTLGLEHFILMGLSLGGPISVTFTTRYPERVQKLVLIDPAGAKSVVLWQAILGEIMPGLAELLPGPFGRGKKSKDVENEFYNPAQLKAFTEKYQVQMKYKGFTHAILSTMRNGMPGDFSEAYRKVGELGIPSLLFWGRDDPTVPFENSKIIRAAIPQIEFHAFEHCGHIPHYEKPEEANPILLEFLT
jgi:pimeloyl-ACP methyl ester carboxylesterase